MSDSNAPELLDEYGDPLEITDPRHPDFEPSDDQMMAAFGTKWHDGL